MANKLTIENFQATTADINAASDALEVAINRLIQVEKSVSEKSKAAVGRAKDASAQIADAMNRIKKILGDDFEQRLTQLERTAQAFERLNDLEKTGRLTAVIAALGRSHHGA